MALAVMPISRAMARSVMASGPPEAITASATFLLSAVVSVRSRSRLPLLPATVTPRLPKTRAQIAVGEFVNSPTGGRLSISHSERVVAAGPSAWWLRLWP
jgi:hypothetical protein